VSKPGLPAALRKLRQRIGIGQVELARRALVSQSYIAMLETGKRQKPSSDVLKRIATALRVTVSDLLH
jgi:predicted transcriptional regulator